MQRNDSTNKLFEAINNYKTENAESSERSIKTYLKDADLTAKDADGRTPIEVAARLKHWEVVKIIANARTLSSEDKDNSGGALFYAVVHEKDEIVELLLSKKVSTRWRSNDDLNHLMHLAVKDKNLKIIKLLVGKVSASYVNKAGQTAIQLAAAEGFWDGVKVIADNEKTDEKDVAKYTDVLFSAIETHDPANKIDNSEVIISLIKAGANLAGEKNEKTPIQVAYHLGKWDCVQTIAKTKEATKGDPERYGGALHFSFGAGKSTFAELLLKAKASTGWKFNGSLLFPLHLAVKGNEPATVDLLIKYEASPYNKSKAGQTPLELACELGYWECAEKLILIKFNDYQFDGSAVSGLAFFNAIKAGQFKIAEHLIKHGALTTYKVDGLTAMHLAVQKNDIKAIQFLLNNNVSQIEVNAQDETPLELACKLGHWDCAQEIIEYNSRENKNKYTVENLHYENALLHAIKNGNYPIAKLLLENNAPFKRCNSERGVIALHAAITHNHPAIVQLLMEYGADVDIKIGDGRQTLRDLARENYPKCFEVLSKKPVSNASLDISKEIEKRDELFNTLKRNGVAIKDLPQTFDSLGERQTDIAKKIREYLEAQKTIGADVIITTINTLLNFKEAPIPEHTLTELFNLQAWGSVEARYVIDILIYKENRNTFVDGIKDWLLQFRNDIQNTQWKVRDDANSTWTWDWTFRKFVCEKPAWKDGIPRNMEVLLKPLKELDHINLSRDAILSLFLLVSEKLSSIQQLDARHEDTISFYRKKTAECKAITFAGVIEARTQHLNEVAQQPSYVPVLCPTEHLTGMLQTQPQYVNSPERLQYPLATLTNNAERNMGILYPQLSGYSPYVPEQNTIQTSFPIYTDTLVVNKDPEIKLPIELFLPFNQESNVVAQESDVVDTNIDDLLLLPSVPARKIYTDKSNTTTLYRNSPPKYVGNKSEEKVERDVENKREEKVGLGAT